VRQITSHNKEYIIILIVEADTLNTYVMMIERYTRENYGDTKVEKMDDGSKNDYDSDE